MTIRNCAHCGISFQPYPHTPHQTFCSSRGCQRARKGLWQKNKLRNDPDYQFNQSAAQRSWRERNPDYWRNYRNNRPNHPQYNEDLKKHRDTEAQQPKLTKMDVLLPPYLITFRQGTADSLVIELMLPCRTCSCKMDV